MTMSPEPPEGPDRAISLADLDLGAWSADDGLAFEAAEWILGAMIARTTAADAAERAKPVPNHERLAALDEERAGYAAERRQLSVHDRARNNAVVERYADLARRGRSDNNAS